MSDNIFPENFFWGASTAAAQVEGGWSEGGKTPSIWDVAPKEKIHNGENCHTACDQYHHYKEDVALMKEMGLTSYRFSISWPRVVPEEGKINSEGLQYYSYLVDELLKNGIEPLVTLYHWDLPLWQYKKGGWLKKAVIGDYLFFVKAVIDALSDRVQYWITFNEPSCFLMNGYMQGLHAPFEKKYLLLPKFTKIFMEANAKAVPLIRKIAKKKPMIGLSFACGAFIPKDESEESIAQARHDSFYKSMGTMNNRWWMDPILLGKGVSAYGVYHNGGKKVKDFKVDFDFIGVNHYEAFNYSSWGGDKSIDKSKLRQNSLGWVVDERSLYWTMKFVYERYHLPIMITENGISLNDKVEADGTVNDTERIKTLDNFLSNLKKSMEDGIPVLGHNHWSFMDNFEWAEGYAPRFGLVYVDYRTEKRIIKNSGYHYKEIIETNGANIK